MKKIFLITFSCILFSIAMVAQSIGINNTTPHASAILDIKSNNKGVLLPRTSTTSRVAIVNPAKGLLLYDTTTSGFWFHNGTAWAQLSGAGNGWSLTGNAGTNPATNFIGTTDNQPLRFRVNNAWAGELDPVTANIFLGLSAGQSNTSAGTGNTGVGGYALQNNTIGYDNTALGGAALITNTDGLENTAIGRQSLFYNTGGSDNTATGYKTLRNNNAGNYNTATGASALLSNTTASDNTANGYGALLNNTTGYKNTSIGSKSLYNNTTGLENTAIGFEALFTNNNGDFNTAHGYQSLYNNTTGSYNTATGFQPLFSNTSGLFNVATGFQALYNNTSGKFNTALGQNTLYSNTVGDNNTAIGVGALYYNAGYNNIAIGVNSGTHPSTPDVFNTISIGNDDYLNAYQNQVFIGNRSMTFIGGQTPWFTYASDKRVKNNIKEDVKGLDFILRLHPVTYNLDIKTMAQITGNKETGDYPGKYDVEKIKQSGFLAQQVEEAANESGYDFSGCAAPKNQWGLYSLSYEQFVVPLVKAMQEQQTIIEELKKQMAEMKNEIKLLKKKN